MAGRVSVERPQPAPEVNGRRVTATSAVREGVGELLHDVVSLGELQAQLLAVDAHESLQKAQAPAAMLIIGVAVGLAAVKSLLFALAEGLVLQFQCERALAYLVSGLFGSALAGLLLWLAWKRASVAAAVFLRSRTELSENIRWVKSALTSGQRMDKSSGESPCPKS